MARKVKVKVKASRSKKERLIKEYKKAVAERRMLLTYLKAATGVLTTPERELLLEFAQIARRKCDRLRREIQQNYGKHAA